VVSLIRGGKFVFGSADLITVGYHCQIRNANRKKNSRDFDLTCMPEFGSIRFLLIENIGVLCEPVWNAMEFGLSRHSHL